MKKETYIRLMDWGKSTKRRTWWIEALNRYVTNVMYLAYPCLLLWMMLQRDERILKTILVPGISFVLVSIFRNLYDAPRPYVAFSYPSVVKKDKTGKSMPSRHVFSAVIVTVTFYYIVPPISIPMGICALSVCIGRVLAGVHYPKDVIVGAILGLIMGIIGFYYC